MATINCCFIFFILTGPKLLNRFYIYTVYKKINDNEMYGSQVSFDYVK